MTSLAELKVLEERYPFNEEELEILHRGHLTAVAMDNKDIAFITKLALCSPYSFFFLPHNEMEKRAIFIENHILPMGFDSAFRAAVAADAFVSYANQGTSNLSFEYILEGIANTGRRGPQQAASILFDIVGDEDATAEAIIDLAFRLSIAAEAFVVPMLDRTVVTNMLDNASWAFQPLVKSLNEAALAGEGQTTEDNINEGVIVPMLTKEVFINWTNHTAPLLPTVLSTFVHNMIFHGRPYPVPRFGGPYVRPMLDHVSDIFAGTDATLLFPLSLVSSHFKGKMHRMYSSNQDGRSFNRLEWSLLGYSGPSLVLIKTRQDNAVLGAFCALPWKDSRHFQGNSASFLFQLAPTLKVFLPTGRDENFVYCHSHDFDGNDVVRSVGGSHPHSKCHGLGFGGTVDKPRLFIPENLEEVGTATFFDHTYQEGDLLPKEFMETFQVKALEVWGVGGEEAIDKGLNDRRAYRDRTDTAIHRAQTLVDMTQIIKDLQSGFIPNKLYEHRKDVRGRQEYKVDEKHGGYTIDIKEKLDFHNGEEKAVDGSI